jgi:predicted membrane protein
LPYSFDFVSVLATAAEFVGLPVVKHQFFAGLLGIALLAILVAHISYRATVRAPMEPTCCVLAALAVFVLCEALLVGYVRASYGVGPRYATASVVFWAALLAALWKMTQQQRTRVLVPWVAAAAVVAANAPGFEVAWREHISFLTRVTDEVRGGTFNPLSMQRLYELDWTSQAVARLRALQLGPFAPGR